MEKLMKLVSKFFVLALALTLVACSDSDDGNQVNHTGRNYSYEAFANPQTSGVLNRIYELERQLGISFNGGGVFQAGFRYGQNRCGWNFPSQYRPGQYNASNYSNPQYGQNAYEYNQLMVQYRAELIAVINGMPNDGHAYNNQGHLYNPYQQGYYGNAFGSQYQVNNNMTFNQRAEAQRQYYLRIQANQLRFQLILKLCSAERYMLRIGLIPTSQMGQHNY